MVRHPHVPEPGSVNFPTTEQGTLWMQNNPGFLDLVAEFCARDKESELCFEDHSVSFIGEGHRSRVYHFGEAAIKVSTPTTGNKRGVACEPREPGRIHPNLIRQFRYLTSLEEVLEGNEGITVPTQYCGVVATRDTNIRTKGMGFHTNSLRVEAYKDGWNTLDRVSRRWKYTPDQRGLVHDVVRERILVALGNSPLWRGLNLDTPKYCGNVLLEGLSANPYVDTLCIIDQPGDGLLGTAAVSLYTPQVNSPALENIA
jgi:hypothetical protein